MSPPSSWKDFVCANVEVKTKDCQSAIGHCEVINAPEATGGVSIASFGFHVAMSTAKKTGPFYVDSSLDG